MLLLALHGTAHSWEQAGVESVPLVNIKRAVGSCSLKHVNCRDSQRLWCSGQCVISMKVGTHYPSQRISSKLLVSCGFGSCCKCVNTRAVIVVVSCCVYLTYATSCLFTARCTSLSHIVGVSGCLQPAEHTRMCLINTRSSWVFTSCLGLFISCIGLFISCIGLFMQHQHFVRSPSTVFVTCWMSEVTAQHSIDAWSCMHKRFLSHSYTCTYVCITYTHTLHCHCSWIPSVT